MSAEVNVPLLRKAVEWAEAEALKPAAVREWEQGWWVLTPEERTRRVAMSRDFSMTLSVEQREAFQKDPECGTAYCIAGFIASQVGGFDTDMPGSALDIAVDALNPQTCKQVDLCDDLFDAKNTIEDVRRIAEQIAGERL